MRVNLACGDDYQEGYVNLDLREDCRVELVADVRHLPFADGSVDELLANDCLEHFPADQTGPLLAEWRRVLVAGGTLTLKLPNLYALARALIAYDDVGNRTVVKALVRNIYGGHRFGPEGAWDTHHHGFTIGTLIDTLDAAGFDVVASDGELNMTVECKRR